MNKKPITIIALIMGLAVLTGCGNNSTPTGTTPAPTPSATSIPLEVIIRQNANSGSRISATIFITNHSTLPQDYVVVARATDGDQIVDTTVTSYAIPGMTIEEEVTFESETVWPPSAGVALSRVDRTVSLVEQEAEAWTSYPIENVIHLNRTSTGTNSFRVAIANDTDATSDFIVELTATSGAQVETAAIPFRNVEANTVSSVADFSFTDFGGRLPDDAVLATVNVVRADSL